MINWPRAKLKYVASLSYGSSLPQDAPPDGIFRVYGSNGPFSSYSEANTQGPAIIVGRKGSYGKVNWSEQPCFASDTTFFVDSSTTRNNLRWIYWLLQTLHLDEGSDEAAVPGLNRDTAYSKDVLVPPISQQRAIADYLDRETARIDAFISAKKWLLELLAEKRRMLITRAITQGLDARLSSDDISVADEDKISATAPGGNGVINWPRAKLKYVASLSYGSSLPQDAPPDGIFRVYGSNGPFSSYSEANTQGPAIIVGRKGSYGKVNWSEQPCFASDTTFFVDSSTTRNNLRWIYWLLQTLHLDEGSDEAAVPGLNRDTAYSKDVLVPPISQQRAIADYLDRETARIDALCNRIVKSLPLLKERRSALIFATVAGHIDMENAA